MSGFYFGDNSSSASDDDDLNTLPFAAPLARNDFLKPDFAPSTFLSTLHNRHQTLEDLRSELRSRSQLLSKELLDLVNSNYQDFLGLGQSLKSGDEKVEEVRVGLLGFRKEVENVRSKVVEREDTVKDLVDERVKIRRQIAIGRKLIEYNDRLTSLEGQLMVDSAGKNRPINGALDDEDEDSEEEESDSEDESFVGAVSISKLRRNVRSYSILHELEKGVNTGGEKHPFITAQVARVMKVRNTILLDLSTALQQAHKAGAVGKERVMKVMKIYVEMDEAVEAVKTVNELKAK